MSVTARQPREPPGVDVDRLHRLLDDPALGWLVDRLAGRLRRGEPLTGVVRKQGATAEERRAVERLLGRRPRHGGSLSVPLSDLGAVVRSAGAAPDLLSAVQALREGAADEPAARAAEAHRWTGVFAAAEQWAAPPLDRWLEDLRRDGLLRRLAGGEPLAADELLHQVRAVTERLPAAGVPRSVLAADAVGDGHALDDGRPLATLVLRAATHLGGVPAADGAAWRREVWASVGVLVSELAKPVVAHALPGASDSPTGRALAELKEAGEPSALTLRQLLRDPPALPVAGRSVFVCENLAVTSAAADRLGPRSAPLVCTDGQPSAAASTLLRLLADAGARLRYHGDFDWPGLQMANAVHLRVAAAPWRMGVADYERAVARSSRPLAGAPVAAAWDPRLDAAMRRAGRRVEEELVVDDLLGDLAT